MLLFSKKPKPDMENLRSIPLLLINLLLCFHCCCFSLCESAAVPQVPAMFVFGDSLVDNGNNNYLSSIARANYVPYGIDYFQGPTGRFSNGKTFADFLCDLLGLPYPPPYNTPNLGGAALLRGVNYASAAGGILDDSGLYLGQRYSMNQQLTNFEKNLNDIKIAGGGQANLDQFLSRSLVVVVIGSNDYVNNFLLPSMPTSYTYSPEQYANLVLDNFTRQLLRLHGLGTRKLFLSGLGPLGCIPNQRARGLSPADRCIDEVNQIVGYFNRGLRTLVEQLNREHPGSIFVYGNAYGAMGDILNNPTSYGLRVVDQACCGFGRNQGQINCLPLQVPCSNRSEYVFWDAFHPSEAVNAILARRALIGPPSDCYPINVQQMVRL